MGDMGCCSNNFQSCFSGREAAELSRSWPVTQVTWARLPGSILKWSLEAGRGYPELAQSGQG